MTLRDKEARRIRLIRIARRMGIEVKHISEVKR